MAMRSLFFKCVVTILVEALAALLSDEYKLLIGGAPEEVAFLTAELGSMRAFMEVSATDAQTRAWTEELRRLSIDVEDSIHEYHAAFRADDDGMRKALIRAFVDRCARLPSAVRARRRVTQEVFSLKTRVIEAGERWKRYRVDDDHAAVDSCHKTKIKVIKD